MAGLIPAETLERIRDATDIVALIGSHVALKRSGKSFLGLCPFHGEKTPSFSVMPDRGRYHCFGCGVKGSVYDFVMEMDRVSFVEAAEILADRAGVVLEREDGPGGGAPRGPAKNDLYRVNRWAAELFRRQLQTEAGARCRAYLEDRGISAESQELFGIGYAASGWSTLLDAGRRRSVPDKLLVAAGLVIEREGGSGLYDRFRDRLIFPIRDSLERVIAFGGRCLDGSEPKYLNSPETAVFSKRRSLFGVDAMRRLPPDASIYVMEGYTDVVMAVQQGCRSAVATLGTSLTADHARILSRYSPRVVLVFDGDAAGRRAAERGAEVFSAVDLDFAVTRLPAGDDPCDFLRRTGESGLAYLGERAEDFLDFVLGEVAERHDLTNVSGKAQAADELLRLVRAVANPIKQTLVLERVGELLKLDRKALAQRLKGVRAPDRLGPDPVEAPRALPPRSDSVQARAELWLLRALASGVAFPGNWRSRLAPEQFSDPVRRSVLVRFLAQLDGGGGADVDALLLEVRDGEERALLNDLVPAEESGAARDEPDVEGTLSWFERRRHDRVAASMKTRAAGSNDALRAAHAALVASRSGFKEAVSPKPTVEPVRERPDDEEIETF